MQVKHRESHRLFFATDLSGASVELDPTETAHATAVLRLRPGDDCQLTDGNGVRATGVVESTTRHSLVIRITGRTAVVRTSPQLRLCTGIPDRDAFESILLDATALGVARIVPLIAEHCRKPWWDDGWEKLLPRFRQKMVVALKQSDGCFLPELIAPRSTANAATIPEGTVLIADPAGVPCTTLPPFDGAQPVSCFIGPPGGFSNEELALFDQRAFKRVCIAPTRLRTELAATVLCAQVVGRMLER